MTDEPMIPVATITAITHFMDHGTGEPGLEFEVTDEAHYIQLHEGEDSEFWAVTPVDVLNTDGWHYNCVLVITIKLVEGKIVYCFLAVNPNGQPVAYHDV